MASAWTRESKIKTEEQCSHVQNRGLALVQLLQEMLRALGRTQQADGEFHARLNPGAEEAQNEIPGGGRDGRQSANRGEKQQENDALVEVVERLEFSDYAMAVRDSEFVDKYVDARDEKPWKERAGQKALGRGLEENLPTGCWCRHIRLPQGSEIVC